MFLSFFGAYATMSSLKPTFLRSSGSLVYANRKLQIYTQSQGRNLARTHANAPIALRVGNLEERVLELRFALEEAKNRVIVVAGDKLLERLKRCELFSTRTRLAAPVSKKMKDFGV